jgi:AraC family transcriptional regulator
MTTSDQPSPRDWAPLGLLHALAEAEVMLVSPEADRHTVAATRFRFNRLDVELPALGVPAFGINYGAEMLLQRTLHGRRTSGRGLAGDLSLLPPHSPSRWTFDKPGDVALVCLDRGLFDEAVGHLSGRGPGAVEIMPRFVIRDLTLERIAHQLLQAIAGRSAGGRLETDTLAHDLACRLATAHTNLEVRGTVWRHAMAPSRLRRVEEFVLAHLPRDISLEDIAAVAGMSVFHFAKSFRKATGRTPYGYVTEHRLRRARSLLHDHRLTIGQIAHAVGLSHSRFATVFKRCMRMTPSEFRAVLSA